MGRRAHGEGTIYQRADGRWCAAVNLGWQDGKRRRKYLYGHTQAEVRNKLRQTQSDVAAGLPVADDRRSVGDYLTWWLHHHAKDRVRPRTFDSYESRIRLHLQPTIGHLSLAKLAPAHIQQLMADKLASGLSARSVQYIHAVLRVALNNAVRMGIIGRNVATLTDPPRVTKKEIQPLEPADARRFLTTCANDRLHALYSVAISMGLRQAEILGLRWRNLDLDNANLHVTHQLQRLGGQWQFTEPKSDRSRRTLTIPQTCVTALRAHKAGQAAERLAAGPEWDDQDLVFTTHTGRPIDPANQLRHFKRICHNIDLGDRRFHDLRHT